LSLPEGTRRLFAHYEDETLDLRHGRALILTRLLEDGDVADLAWLTSTLPEAEIADWFGRHGGRELWRVVLGREPSPVHPEAQALWPL